MVNKAFAILDKSNEGVITVSDIIGTYDVSMNPEYIEGKKTKEQILMEFLNNFEGTQGKKDG